MKRKLLLNIILLVAVVCTLISGTTFSITAAEEPDNANLQNDVDVNTDQSLYSGGSGFSDAETLTLNSIYTVSIDTAYEKEYFVFVPLVTGFYTFESFSSTTVDSYATLYNSLYNVIEYNDDGYDSLHFSLTYHLVKNELYYFTAEGYSDSTGEYSVRITNTSSSSCLSTPILSFGMQSNVRIMIPYVVRCFSFTPTVSGEYLFYSTKTDSNNDPTAWIYDSNLTLMGQSDDGAGNSNFRLSAFLTAGSTYYMVAGQYDSFVGQYAINILISYDIPSGEYYIKNSGSKQFIDIEGPSLQEWVQQNSFHAGIQSRWLIQKQSDGYYTLRSLYGSQYYVGISGTNTNVDNIKLFSSISNYTKWKFYKDSSGAVFIEPKSILGRVLYAPNFNNETQLQLSLLSTDVSNRNNWDVGYVAAIKDYSVPSKTFNLQYSSALVDGDWYSLIATSVNAWNNSAADTNISLTTSSSPYYIEVGEFADSWYGLCSQWCAGTTITKANISINSGMLSSDNMRRSTITHEIGHLLGLKDNPPVSPNDSLMMHARNKEMVFVPMEFDIHNVKFLYD